MKYRNCSFTYYGNLYYRLEILGKMVGTAAIGEVPKNRANNVKTLEIFLWVKM
jgi:hypothetical protein